MLSNYFKIAWRNLTRNKISAIINIGGLSAGMMVAILVGLWIHDELSFNTYHDNYDRIAQVMIRSATPDGIYHSDGLQYPLATELTTNYRSEFKRIVRASWVQDYVLAAGRQKISGTGQCMDAGAPALLGLKMIAGSRDGLKDTYSILLSSALAKSLFGASDPVNQLIKLNGEKSLKVTGVYEDLPVNSTFHRIQFFAPFELWATMNSFVKESMTDWSNHYLRMYAELKPGMEVTEVSRHIKDAEIKNLANFKDEAAFHPEIYLEPMSRWHLYPSGEHGLGIATAPVNMLRLTGATGLFVLLLACINFMNLTTARSEKRAREVGIRKVVGSLRRQLVWQFYGESLLVVFCAFWIALLLAGLCLPWFNALAAKDMQLPWLSTQFWTVSALFIVVTGLLAGSYPALYLSSFQPVKVLKGTFRVGRLAALPRKALVVTQFTVAVALIICTIIVYRQIQLGKNRPVGYTREGVIAIDMKSPDFYGKYETLRSELKNTGVVTEVSESMGMVTGLASNNGGFEWQGKPANLQENFGTIAVTTEFGKTMGWQFVEGRDFSRSFGTDSSGLVINEAAVRFMALKDPVGEPVTWKWYSGDGIMHYKIIGVVKDMVMESPFKPVAPTMFYLKGLNGGVSCINVRINPRVSAAAALPKIGAVFARLIPSAPFEYKFIGEEYAAKFAQEDRAGKLAAFFTALAIFISCLGLFGLASFVAEQRIKEIGIRKVLGASVFNLWRLLSGEFVALIVIALCIASPIAWYFMHNWLQNYVYSSKITWWIFAAAGLGAIGLTLFTVSFQSIRAALMNPVKSLKSE